MDLGKYIKLFEVIVVSSSNSRSIISRISAIRRAIITQAIWVLVRASLEP